jgi:hypothetical protein
METLKKYWKEIIVVILLFSFIGYVMRDKFKESEQEKVQKALDDLNTAQKEYLEILELKRSKLEQEQKELEGLESVISSNINSTTTTLNTVKDEKAILKKKYKVGSVYNTNKLDSLLRIYSKQGG